MARAASACRPRTPRAQPRGDGLDEWDARAERRPRRHRRAVHRSARHALRRQPFADSLRLPAPGLCSGTHVWTSAHLCDPDRSASDRPLLSRTTRRPSCATVSWCRPCMQRHQSPCRTQRCRDRRPFDTVSARADPHHSALSFRVPAPTFRPCTTRVNNRHTSQTSHPTLIDTTPSKQPRNRTTKSRPHHEPTTKTNNHLAQQPRIHLTENASVRKNRRALCPRLWSTF